MALTKNLKRTGAAARTEREEEWDSFLLASAERRREIASAMLQFADTLNELKRIDPGWEAWYDDDRNIPPEIHWLDKEEIDGIIARINQRILEVRKGVAIDRQALEEWVHDSSIKEES